MDSSNNNSGSPSKASGERFEVSSEKSNILKDLCRNGSLSRLKSHARSEDIVIEDWQGKKDDLTQTGHWLSLIFIASKAIKIVFKTHYASKDISFFTANALEIPSPDRVSQKQCEDFVKEFCNLSAGLIKIAFEDSGSQISLPLVTRASDDMFFNADYTGGKQIFHDQWMLKHPKSKLACSVVIEIFDKKTLDRIILPSFGANEDNGDVEFF